jgi:hypothetical protein
LQIFDLEYKIWGRDLMEKAFEKIANDGEMMLDKEFMMNIFEPIVD